MTEPRLCFARRHMSMAASAYHSYALAVSRNSGVFYSDDRRDAAEFSASARTIFALRSWLEHHGWFRPVDKGKRRQRNSVTGQFLAIRYRVLDHDEWTMVHPGHCRFPRQGNNPVSPDVKSADGPAEESTDGPDAKSTDGETPPSADSSSTVRKNGHSPSANFAAKTVSDSLYPTDGTPFLSARGAERAESSLSLSAKPKSKSVGAVASLLAPTKNQIKNFLSRAAELGWNSVYLKGHIQNRYGVRGVKNLSPAQFTELVAYVERISSRAVH